MMRRTVGNSVLGTVVAQRRARMLVLLLAVALCGYLLVVPALPVLAGRPVPPGGTLTPPRQATTSAKGRSHQVGTGTTQPRSGPVPAASAATHVPPVAGAVGTQPRHTDVTLPKVGGQRLSQPVSQPSTGQTGFVPGRSQEVMRLRTPRSTVFANPDGTRTLRVYSSPVFVEGAHGQYLQVDPRLNRGGDGRYTPAAAVAASIAGSSTDPVLASVRFGAGMSAGFGVDKAAAVTVAVNGGTATFAGVRPGADVVLTADADRLKDDLVLRSPAAPTSWLFPLTLQGLSASLDPATGAVLLTDAAGTVQGLIPHGFMTDAKVDPQSGLPARSDAVTYSLVPNGSGVALKMDLDAAWIHSPDRVFPITVDPTLTRFNLDGDDTYVSSHNHAGQDNSTQGDLLVGTYNGGAERDASYLHFSAINGALAGKYVLGAWLNLYDYWAYSCNARPATVYRVTQPWSGSTTKYWPGPAYDAAHPLWTSSFAYGYYSCPAGGWATFPIDNAAVTRWTHGAEPFYGFTVRASETDSYGWKRFASAQYSQAAGHPYIDVQYADQGATYYLPNPQFNPAVTAADAGGITVRVTNWGSTTWTATNGYKLNWTVLNSSGATVATGPTYVMPHDVAPGQSADIPIQVGPISGLGDYTLTLDMQNAGGTFSAQYGAPAGTAPFSIVNGPPRPKNWYPQPGGFTDSVTPTLWVQYFDPDNTGTSRSYSYKVCTGTPDAPVGCQSSTTPSSATWTVPAGTVHFGQQAFWYVTLSDGLASQQYGPYWFTPLTAQPEITSHLAGARDNPDTPGLNPQVGNYTTTAIDASVSVAGPHLDIERTYNSQDPRTTGAFGAGWSSPIDQFMVWEGDGTGDVVVRLASGQEVRFGQNKDADHTYSAPPGMNLTLTRLAAPKLWVVREASGRLTYFDDSGRLDRVVDPDGRAQTYMYASDGTLARIIDVYSGRVLYLRWAGGHVVSVFTDPGTAGGTTPTWTYTYTGNQLTKVCSPLSANACVSYAYTGSSFYQATVRDDNPMAYWTLGETSGGKAKNVVARTTGDLDGDYHLVGLGEPGALTGSPDTAAHLTGGVVTADSTPTPTSRPFPNPIPAASNVALPDNLLNRSQAFAIELWFKTAAGMYGTLFGQQSSDLLSTPANHTPMLYVGTDGKLRGEAWTGGAPPIASSGRVDDGNWHHVVLSAAVTTQSLYLDGSLVGSLAGTIDHVDMTKYYLGGGTGAPAWPATTSSKAPFPFIGQLDEAAVYGHPLSQAQVLAHYQARTGGDRLSTVTEPGTFTAAAITYDPVTGRVTKLTDRNGANWTLPALTSTSELKSIVLSSDVASPTTYTYDLDHGGRLSTRTDGSGTTTWQYNDAGFVSSVTDPNDNTTTYQTDARGNVLAQTTCRDMTDASQCHTAYFGYYLNAANPLDPRNDQRIWAADARSTSATDTRYRTVYTLDSRGRTVDVQYPTPAGYGSGPHDSYAYTSDASYTRSTQARAFTPANDTVLPLTGDDANQQITLPFAVTYYGMQYQKLWVSTNGYAAFTQPAALGAPTAAPPQPDPYTNALFAFADDLVVDASSSVRTATTGTAPDRQFTIEWRNVFSRHDSTSSRFSVEAVIGENGTITYDYSGLSSAATRGASATVAVENWDGSAAVTAVYHQAQLASDTAIVFTPVLNSAIGYVMRPHPRWFTPGEDTPLAVSGDESVAQYDLPMPVVFYGQTYSHIWVSSNGFVSFTDPGGAHGTGRTGLPAAGAPAYSVFPFWDDLVVGSGASVSTSTFGSAPNRETVVEWKNVALQRDPSKTLTFAVDFSENGQISFDYDGLDNADERGAQATVGIQGPAGTGMQYSYQQANLASAGGVIFAPNGTYGAASPGGLVSRSTGRNDAVTRYFYGNSGDLHVVTDPVGLSTTYSQDGLGRLVSVNRSAVIAGSTVDYGTTRFKYNDASLLTTATAAPVTNPVTGDTHTAVATYTYDDAGHVTKRVASDSTGGDPARTTLWGYDPAGRLTSTTAADNAVTIGTWDTEGNLATVTQPNGLALNYQYNDHHQLVETTATGPDVDPMDPSATSLVLGSWAYDPGGRLASATDAMGREADYTYLGDNLLATVARVQRDANGTITALTPIESDSYDPAGRLTGSTAQGGAQTAYAYDPAGYLTTRTFDPTQLVRTATFTNNIDGTVRTRTDTGAASPGRSEQTAFTYDPTGRVLTTSVDNTGGSPATLTTTDMRDPRGLVTSETDPAGITTTVSYDTHDRPVTVTGAARTVWVNGTSTPNVSPATTMGRDTFDEVTHLRGAAGAVTTAGYDPMGRPTSLTLPTYTPPGGTPITSTTSIGYDPQGNPTRITDPLNRVTTVTYDKYGNARTMTAPDPDGAGPKTSPVSTNTYDRVGETLTATDPTGAQTVLTYDYLGRPATSAVSDRDTGQTVFFTTTYGYDAAGDLSKVTSPLSHSTILTYNPAGEPTKVEDSTGRFVQLGYDLAGRRTSTAVGTGVACANFGPTCPQADYENPVTLDSYDLAGRHTGQRDCTVTTTGDCATVLRSRSWAYDGDSQPTLTTSPEGRTTASTYDTAGQLASTTQRTNPADPATAVTVQLGYDALGDRTRMVDGNGNATTYTHNIWGLPESTVEPPTTAHPATADRTWTTSYDAAAQPVKDVLPGGVTRIRTFNGLGQLTDETGTGSEAATAARHLDYDPLGRVTSASGPAGNTTYTYNDRGLLTHTAAPGNTATFGYDAEGNLRTRTDAAGAGTYTYDSARRLSTASDPLTGTTANYSYDIHGRVTTVYYGTSMGKRTYTYDNLGRTTTDTQTQPNGTVVARTGYTYDNDDLLATRTTTGYVGAGTSTYGYDGLDRLTRWTRPDSAQVSYGYDNASNRTTVTDPAGTRTTGFDARNRAASASGGGMPAQTWTWSARGTLSSTTSGTSTSSYTFDAFERMASAATPGHTDNYTYDGLDRLAQRNGVAFAYDDQTNNPVRSPSPSTGNPVLTFQDPDGNPLSAKDGSNPATAILADPNHSDVVGAIDPATGNLTASASYDPYGQTTASSGGLPLGYQGGYTDPDTGQVATASRWYNPAAGTFTSRDTTTLAPNPVAQTNRYVYGNGSPVNGPDPSGHNQCSRPHECDREKPVPTECALYGRCPDPSVHDCDVVTGQCPDPNRHKHNPDKVIGRHGDGGENRGRDGHGGPGSPGGKGGGGQPGHYTPPPVTPRKPLGSNVPPPPSETPITGGEPIQNLPATNPPPQPTCTGSCLGDTLPSTPAGPRSAPARQPSAPAGLPRTPVGGSGNPGSPDPTPAPVPGLPGAHELPGPGISQLPGLPGSPAIPAGLPAYIPAAPVVPDTPKRPAVCDPLAGAACGNPGLRRLALDALKYLYNHIVLSAGFCFIRCLSLSFQGGTFQSSWGEWGFSMPGPGIGWASRSATDRQNDCSSYGADVGPFGMSRCIGLRPGGGLDLGDWEISMQERGVGVWLGRQQQIDQWSPSWLQWK